MELCRGRLPGGAVWEQPAADGRVRAGGGGLRAAAGGHHRGLGGQESPPQRYEGSSRGQGQPPPGSRFPPPPEGTTAGPNRIRLFLSTSAWLILLTPFHSGPDLAGRPEQLRHRVRDPPHGCFLLQI